MILPAAENGDGIKERPCISGQKRIMDNTKKNRKINFSHFLEKFPEVALPATLGDETHHQFSQENDPLPKLMVEQFILPLEEMPADEFTEFVACFKIPDTHEFHTLVYWRAGLMNYQYTLATFTKKGELIDKRVIAGTFSDGNTLIKSIATIDEDWEIFIISGQTGTDRQKKYDASTSTAYKLELLPDGKIKNN
jgi:hypothetical protein